MKLQKHMEDDENEIKDIPKTKMSKFLMVKNVSVLSTGVLLLFTAYDGLSMLQSTINLDHGIGIASQFIVYAGFCVSSLIFPKYVITKLGSKRTLVFSMLSYIPYITYNFYPHWILMIPASILIGLGASLLWGSQATYLNDISVMYASIRFDSEKKSSIAIIEDKVKYNAKNGNTCESQIKGFISYLPKSPKTQPQYGSIKSESFCYSPGNGQNNLIDSSNASHTTCIDVQRISPDRCISTIPEVNHGQCEDSVPHKNSTSDCGTLNLTNVRDEMQIRTKLIESTTARVFGFHGMAYLSSHLWSNLMTYYVLKTDVRDTFSNRSCVCGADFCNVESECFLDNLETPSDSIWYILTGSCTCLGLFSILIVALFLDPLEKQKKKVSFSLELMMATCKMLKRKELLLLIPASIHIGMFQGFYTGDFTKAFIGCAWGIYHVGLVSTCYGFACGASSTVAGWLVKRLGRIPIFTAAAVVNVTADVFLLLWKPDREDTGMFFLAAALWGVHVGIIWSQLRALYGMLFKEDEEAAFAAFHVWYSLGFCLSFGYSNYLCTFVKIYILLFVSSLGFIGYLIVEHIQKIKRKI